ncbi:MAG TPA: thioredoxin-like domain-containing protein [Bacteroidales bacterium]|nr:thioredoxin-like domain-containing protein [Bacteroidales bacterium]
MKQQIATLLFIVTPLLLWGQDERIEAYISNLPDGKVYLSAFHEDKYVLRDSIQSFNGSFYFFRDTANPGGMYRLDFGGTPSGAAERQKKYIEFIWNNESFKITADFEQLASTTSFSNSFENRLLSEFRNYELAYERKINVLFMVLDQYPPGDRYYKTTAQFFISLQHERDSFLLSFNQSAPGTLVSKLALANRSPVIPLDMKAASRQIYMQEHFFDQAMIDDPALLYLPVYNRKIIDYLMLYRESDYTFSEQQEAFKKAVDIIMANVSGNPDLRGFAVEYMLDGFESFGMEKLQTYIIETYYDETCATDEMELAKERVKGYKKMAEGQTAEDILLRSHDNEIVQLSAIDADYTLVLFWATYCPHCVEMIPDLKKWYKSDRPDNMEVLAISIDTLKSDWTNYLKANPLPWINAHEPMGWEGKSAEDYNIYATPTMFLLDRKRTIIARPFKVRELKKVIRKF